MIIKPPPIGFEKFNAPLVHKICELYKLFHDCLKLFPKQERFSLGQKIENIILEMLESIIIASYSPLNKRESIINASNKTDLLKYLIRLAYETKSINDKKYLILEEKVIEIGKMIGGWIRYI